MHHERNLMSLCRAVTQANSEGLAFILSLVGDGSERLSLERYAANSNNAIRVSCPVPYEQIPELLAKVHVGVLPFPDEQKFRVSSPIKLFEYMAAGLPILATRITCHVDVVASGNFVFWAEISNEQGLLITLRQVRNSYSLLKEMGKLALVAAEKWTWKDSADKLSKSLETGFNKTLSGSKHDLEEDKINQ
jgi:glycosyltransferase involved in cell wall biosynthesis